MVGSTPADGESRTVPPAAGAGDRISGLRLRRAERVKVDVATSAEELRALKPEYDRLHTIGDNTLPFALHEWHVAWWNHLAKTERLGLATRSASTWSSDDRGECVAIVPFVSTRRDLGVVPDRVARRCSASDPNFTEIRSALVAPGPRGLAAERRHRAPARRRRAGTGSDWSGTQGPVRRGPRRPSPRWRGIRRCSTTCVDLAPTWEAFRAGLKRNIRESLRHCYNSLKRDGLSFELEVAETPEAVRNALHTFAVAARDARRAHEHGRCIPHRFASLASRKFLFEVCDRLGGAGRRPRVRAQGPRLRRRDAHRVRRRPSSSTFITRGSTRSGRSTACRPPSSPRRSGTRSSTASRPPTCRPGPTSRRRDGAPSWSRSPRRRRPARASARA